MMMMISLFCLKCYIQWFMCAHVRNNGVHDAGGGGVNSIH